MLRVHVAGLIACLAVAPTVAGCSPRSSGVVLGVSRTSTESYLRIWLDGNAAKQRKARQPVRGYSRFRIKRKIASEPRLMFEIQDPQRFGRITMVTVQIHRKLDGRYPQRAEYTIYARNGKSPAAQLKPNIEYDLGAIGRNFIILDANDNEVSGIKLKPRSRYMLVLTVIADTSETAQVRFKS